MNFHKLDNDDFQIIMHVKSPSQPNGSPDQSIVELVGSYLLNNWNEKIEIWFKLQSIRYVIFESFTYITWNDFSIESNLFRRDFL